MAEKDMITMSRKEARRLHLIHQALDKRITQAEAAALAGLSDRQIRRLIKRIRQDGDEGICHQSRGASSNHQISAKIKEKALRLFREEYRDFNLTHATEQTWSPLQPVRLVQIPGSPSCCLPCMRPFLLSLGMLCASRSPA